MTDTFINLNVYQGWVECVGCADRACYDLTQHTKHSGVKLTAEKALAQPKTLNVVEVQVDKGAIGKLFKQDAKLINTYLESLGSDEIEKKLSEATDGFLYELMIFFLIFQKCYII